MEELVYYLLKDKKKFQQAFQILLNSTPRTRGASHVEFWVGYLLSIALTAQNTQLGTDLKIENVCFCIGKLFTQTPTYILKLAFKIYSQEQYKKEEKQYTTILRSFYITASDQANTQFKKANYSPNEHQAIQNIFKVALADIKNSVLAKFTINLTQGRKTHFYLFHTL